MLLTHSPHQKRVREYNKRQLAGAAHPWHRAVLALLTEASPAAPHYQNLTHKPSTEWESCVS